MPQKQPADDVNLLNGTRSYILTADVDELNHTNTSDVNDGVLATDAHYEKEDPPPQPRRFTIDDYDGDNESEVSEKTKHPMSKMILPIHGRSDAAANMTIRRYLSRRKHMMAVLLPPIELLIPSPLSNTAAKYLAKAWIVKHSLFGLVKINGPTNPKKEHRKAKCLGCSCVKC